MSSARPHLVSAFQRLRIVLLIAIAITGCSKRNVTPQRNLVSAKLSATQQIFKPRININTARATELETLPGIGKALAARIVEHRDKYGPFRKPEHLIIVRGFSERRFRALQEVITVE